MRRALAPAALAALLSAALAGCGADGEPLQPHAGASVTVGAGGVSAAGRVSVSRGPFTLGISL